MTARRSASKNGHGALQIFSAPLIVALLSTVGLLSALLGDDNWDVISWVTLTVPVLLILWYVTMSRLRQGEAGAKAARAR